MRQGHLGFNYLMAGATALRVPSTGDVQWVIPVLPIKHNSRGTPIQYFMYILYTCILYRGKVVLNLMTGKFLLEVDGSWS